jgi:hypothetical protein
MRSVSRRNVCFVDPIIEHRIAMFGDVIMRTVSLIFTMFLPIHRGSMVIPIFVSNADT